MKIGISIAGAHRVEDVREGARRIIDRAGAAASAGLDSLFLGDHHVTRMPYYQNSPMMGRLLAEWDERDAGALYLLPLWNPVLAAEQIATLACIAQGKFIMQCGLGWGEAEFKAMGANIRYRPSAFEQSLECLRALWRGETVSLDGRWKFQDASISPLPPSPIEVWIGASAPVAIDRAARLGDGWLADPAMTLEQAHKAMEIYQSALAGHGKTVPGTVAIRRDVYVAETVKEADELKETIASRGYRGFDPEALIIGDVDQVVQQLRQFESLGYTDIITRNLHTDPARALASMERLGQVRQMI